MRRYVTYVGTWLTLAMLIGSLLAPIVSAQELVDGTPASTTTQDMTGDPGDAGTAGGTGDTGESGNPGDTGDPSNDVPLPPVNTGGDQGQNQNDDSGAGDPQGHDQTGTGDYQDDAPPAPEVVWPGVLDIADGFCDSGTHYGPAVTAYNTEAITYQVNGPNGDGSFSVIAYLNGDRVWGDLSGTGWAIEGDPTVAVYYGTAAVNPCPAPTAVPTQEPTAVPTDEPTDAPTGTPAVDEPTEVPAGTPVSPDTKDPEQGQAVASPAASPVAKNRMLNLSIEGASAGTGGYTIQKTVNPSFVIQNSTITYSIIVGFGGEVANTPFTITDVVPAPLQVTGSACAAVPMYTTCSTGGSGNNLSWQVTPGGYNGTITVTVTAFVPDNTAGQTITNDAYVNPNGSPASPVIIASNTFTINAKLPPTTPTQPAGPTIVQGQCVNGAVVNPTLTFAPANGVTYSWNNSLVKPGATVFVTATIPDGFSWQSDPLPGGWQIQTATTAILSVTFDTAICQPGSNLGTPTATSGFCTNGNWTKPKVSVPGNTASVKYSLDLDANTGDWTVTATLQNGYKWGDTTGWTVTGNTATISGHVYPGKCEPGSNLANPTVTDGACTNGNWTAPTITPPANTASVHYSATIDTGTGVWKVTATLQPGYSWGNTAGWTVSGNTATKSATATLNKCKVITPQNPGTKDGSCVNGSYTAPKITPATTTGVTYTVTGPDSNGNFTVTASLTGTDSVWGANPAGWSDGANNTRVYSGTVKMGTCQETTPTNPTVKDGSCVAGVYTAPTVTATDSTSVHYVVSGPDATGAFTVTASLKNGYQWGNVSGSWTAGANNTYVFSGTANLNKCAEITPATPTYGDGVCNNGVYTSPFVNVPANTNTITYSVTPATIPASGGEFTITATLSGSNAWGNLNGTGWVKKDAKTATFTKTLKENPCGKITPAAPTFGDGVCQNGIHTAPYVNVPANTDTITYSMVPATMPSTGGSFTITATLSGSNTWGNLDGTGWEKTGPTTATFTRTLKENPCTTVNLVAPKVTDGACTGGTYTPSSVVGVATEGVTYGTPNINTTNGNFTITATIGNGSKWGTLATGWTKDSPTKATFSGTLDLNNCVGVDLVAPSVTDGVCEGGSYTAPTVSGVATAGVTYGTPTINDDGTFSITATIGNGSSWGTLATGWHKDSATKATYSGTLNLNKCEAIVPVDPTLTQAQCVGGTLTAPTLAFATTPGITYYKDREPTNGGTVTVTAVLGSSHSWGDLSGSGWTQVNKYTATKDFTFETVECTPVTPATPDVTQAQCVNGALTAPTLALANSDAITYTWDTAKVVNGGQVTITATLADTYSWGNDLNGWTKTSSKTAERTVRFENVECTPASPVDPAVTQAVCTGGELTTPSVVTTDTDAITYSISGGMAPGAKIVVTAVLSDGFAWPTTMPGDWQKVDAKTATLTFWLDEVECTQVVPAAPVVTNAVCTGGHLTTPTLEIQETTGITYTTDTEPANGGTVVVTATLQDTYSWGTMPDGWTKTGPDTATYTVHFENVECTPVTPVDPIVTQAQCLTGQLTSPTVTTTDTDAIHYTFDQADVVNGGTVVVTATLQDTYSWGEMPAGWTAGENGTATFTVQLDNVECTPVVPVDPEVTQVVCTQGALTTPDVVPATTEGISYTFNQDDVVNGGTVVVTATLLDGFGWGDMPEGWTEGEGGTATFTVQLDLVDCEYGGPVDPEVTQASCVGGTLTPPSIIVHSNDDIVYTFNEEDVVNGGTVLVTATVQDGYAWTPEMPAGWTRIDSATATFTVHLSRVLCAPVTPVAPDVTQATCSLGTITAPVVTPAKTTGIVYSFDEKDVVNGGTVVITATVQNGYAWASPLPEGWTRVDAATATYTVKLDTAKCETPVTPPAPKPTPEKPVTPEKPATSAKVTNLPVTGSGSGSAAATSGSDGLMLATLLMVAALAAGALGWTVRNRANRRA
ncbi:MAG: hypothetical protein WBA63_03280 [Thermomicrobiales bacterium]